MRRRPTEVYQTERPSATGELPVIRRAPRFTASINAGQSTDTRGVGGTVGGPFVLPSFDAPSTAPTAAPGSPATAVDCCG